MTSKHLFCTLASLALAAPGRGASTPSSAPPPTGQIESAPLFQLPDGLRKYNVLIWALDTTRADHFGIYGYHRDTTPFIDQLAELGLRWDNYTTSSTWTWPSVVSMMSSLTVPTHKTLASSLAMPRGWASFPEILEPFGYQSVLVSSNHLLTDLGRQLSDRFDVSVATLRPDETLTDVVIDAIRDPAGRPFFIHAQPVAGHAPYVCPPPFDSLFVDDAFYGGLGDLPKINDSENCDGGMQRSVVIDSILSMDWYVAQYDGLMAYMDYQFSRIYEAIEDEGLIDSTLIVITADHAENLAGDHNYYFCHTDQYQSNIRLPFIVLLPEEVQEARGPLRNLALGGLPNHIDLLPTVLDLLGVETPAQAQGRSLIELPQPDRRIGHNHLGRSYQEGNWKVVQKNEKVEPGPDTGLYDIAADPDEQNDLSGPMTALRDSLEAIMLGITLQLEAIQPPFYPTGDLYHSDLNDPAETDEFFYVSGKMRLVEDYGWGFIYEDPDSNRVMYGQSPPGEPENLRMPGSLIEEILPDYNLSLRMQLNEGIGYLGLSALGKFFYSNFEFRPGYLVTIEPDSIGLGSYLPDGENVDAGRVAYPFGLDAWQEIVVTNDGDTVTVNIGGRDLLSIPTHQGIAGATYFGLAMGSEMRVDDIRVWR